MIPPELLEPIDDVDMIWPELRRLQDLSAHGTVDLNILRGKVTIMYLDFGSAFLFALATADNIHDALNDLLRKLKKKV